MRKSFPPGTIENPKNLCYNFRSPKLIVQTIKAVTEMSIKFTVFADFHYEKFFEHTGVSGLKTILTAANENRSELILHAGDLHNNWKAAPEILETYLDNEYGIPVYGAYGNHETESCDTPIPFITEHLTNDENVTWGTDDGKIGDGETTYYYCDKDKYRFIFTDTNHHYFVKEGVIKHTPAGMGEAPIENKPRHLLGPKQLKWLESVLSDAAEKELSCIIVSHAGFADFEKWGWQKAASGPSDDIKAVRKIFNKVNKIRPHTVLMCINGHYHFNHIGISDGILFFDVNSSASFWYGAGTKHYPDDMTYNHIEYDADGNAVSSELKKINGIPAIDKKWYKDRPLYANVLITDDFEITIEGTEAKWIAGIEPPKLDWIDCDLTKIDSGKFKL